ncbi:MAG: Ig-like domain-containing protein [Planctomycetota bacterium]
MTACDEKEATPLRVEQVSPPIARGTVLLNQSVRVLFSAALDPSTIGRPAVRMIDSSGRDVGGRFEVEGRELYFHPRVPRRSDLGDGSLRPGETFRLEIAGLPRSYAVRDLEGNSLAESLGFEFQVPQRNGAGNELFVATHLPGDLFALRTAPDGTPPTLAVGGRDLLLDFTLPPLPSSVTKRAFELTLLSEGEIAFKGAPESVVVLSVWRPGASEPGTAVRLTLAAACEPKDRDKLYLSFPRGEHSVLRDFSGAPLQVLGPGSRPIDAPIEIPSARLDWRSLGLEDYGPGPGFELSRNGKPVPRLRRSCGRGIRGDFVGEAESRLEASGSVLEFSSFVVPRGTQTTIDLEGEPAVLRCLGEVRIEGDLVLENAPERTGWRETGSIERVLRDAGFAVVSSGPIRIRGSVRGDGPNGEESNSPSVALIGQVRIELTGDLPYGCFIGYEQGDRPGDLPRAQVIGAAPGNVSGQFELEHGAPEGARGTVRARTRWTSLPEGRDGTLVFKLATPEGVEVALELDGGRDRPRLPFVDGRVVVPPGPEIRFRLLLAADASEDLDPDAFGGLAVSFR